MDPVPGYVAGTPYGARGAWWSCDRDTAGEGVHTGVDYPAPMGARVVAARPGRVAHCDHGDAFGFHQLEVAADDGTRDFYAHMVTRTVPDGRWVAAGDELGQVGAEGNATGPHLHFERHAVSTGPWSCAIVRDPAPSIAYQPKGDDMTEDDWRRLRRIVRDEVRDLLTEPVDAREPEPTTVRRALRLAADHARDPLHDGR